jgi:3-hydroxybutyryl-CoA dehydrogenase
MTQEEAEAILSRIKPIVDLSEATKDVDLVIEARTEEMNLKKDTFTELDRICPEHTIFATNTSYLSVTEIAMVTKRADKFLGTHWFNPPQLMRGVEVVRTEKTSQETVDTVVDLLKKLGKEPAVCKDTPGFVVNRVLQVWYNEGLKLLDEDVAAFQDVDKAIKTACNFRMGPFELRDFTGMYVALLGTEIIYKELGKEQFRPARCMVMKVKSGDVGRKAGRGFYEYK